MPLKVLYIAAECKPFSKAGGVGDVAGELPPALRAAGVEIEVVTPFYESVPARYGGTPVDEYEVMFDGSLETVTRFEANLDGITVHLLKNLRYFEGQYGSVYVHSPAEPFDDDVRRFSFFSKACMPLVRAIKPDIVHVNDWVLGYLFAWMALDKLPARRVITIHNATYQGNVWKPRIKDRDIGVFLEHAETADAFTDPREAWNSVNALRLGIELADVVTTVNPTYAQEIQQPEDSRRYFEGGKGLDETLRGIGRSGHLIGILNGFNYTFEPTGARFAETIEKKAGEKAALASYFERPHKFLLGFVGRAVEQKFKLLAEPLRGKSVLEHILDLPDVNVAILATGVPQYEAFIGNTSLTRYPATKTYDDLMAVPRRRNYMATIAFDKVLATRISLASDALLMPSVFEPCGITQLEAMYYATPPVVRLTGGLADTVVPYPHERATGFGFDGAQRDDILENLLTSVREAAQLFLNAHDRYTEIQRAAFERRYTWSVSAQSYVEVAYGRALGTPRQQPR